MTLHPVILAGGSGTRMWPLSREAHPKQFLPLMGEHSLFQDTVLRLDGLEEVAAPLILCNEEHRFLVAEHMRQLEKNALAITLEPVGRNTAPALTLAAMMLLDNESTFSDGDPVMLVLPSDHVVRDIETFQKLVRHGIELAQGNAIITFGILPDSPRTGYGYIRMGNRITSDGGSDFFQVAEFVEKPDRDAAKKMIKSEAYLWNSGMFMMRASVWMGELRRLRPDIVDACSDAHAALRRDGDFYRPGATEFAACPSESIDYAVMEHMSEGSPQGNGAKCIVLPMEIGWTDLGAWSSLWEEREQDAGGNVIQGDVYAHSMSNSLIISQRRLVAAVGLRGHNSYRDGGRCARRAQGSGSGRQGTCRAAQEPRTTGAREPSEDQPPLGFIRNHRYRTAVSGEATHYYPRRGTLLADAPSPGRTLGRGEGNSKSYAGRRSVLVDREPVSIRSRRSQPQTGKSRRHAA